MSTIDICGRCGEPIEGHDFNENGLVCRSKKK